MIRQGILVFENTPQGARSAGLRVAGLSLLERHIRTLARAGIQRLLVLAPASMNLELSKFVEKLDISVERLTWGGRLAPALNTAEDCLVLCGDYVHHHSSLSALLEGGLKGFDLVAQAAGEPPQDGVFQTVSTSSGSADFSEAKSSSSSVSSGAFLCAADLFSPAQLGAASGSLQDFLKNRTRGRKIEVRSSTPALWRRVWDRRSSRSAKNMLFSQVTKSTSGFVSRHINARVSIPTSKLLIETGISPHATTILLVLTTGLASAYLVTRPDEYIMLALAGILWQFAAIFDRCDGEIARVKLCESNFGAWFDTITDNIAYVCAYVGLMIGMHRLYPETTFYVYLGAVAAGELILCLAFAYGYAIKIGNGSLQHYLMDSIHNVPASEKGPVHRFMERHGFIAKRDFFSFFFFLAAIANCVQLIYWFLIVGLHLLVIGMLILHKKVVRAGKETPESHQIGEPAEDALPVLDSLQAPPPSVEDR